MRSWKVMENHHKRSWNVLEDRLRCSVGTLMSFCHCCSKMFCDPDILPYVQLTLFLSTTCFFSSRSDVRDIYNWQRRCKSLPGVEVGWQSANSDARAFPADAMVWGMFVCHCSSSLSWWKNQTTRYILPRHWLYECCCTTPPPAVVVA